MFFLDCQGIIRIYVPSTYYTEHVMSATPSCFRQIRWDSCWSCKMATGGDSKSVTFLVTYSGQKLSVTIPTNAKVGDVVGKAIETLGLKREDLPLSLLYRGSPLPDDAPVDVSVLYSMLCSGSARGSQAWLCVDSYPRLFLGRLGEVEGRDSHPSRQESQPDPHRDQSRYQRR